MKIIENAMALRIEISGWRSRGESVGLVPTMGALHAGHIELMHQTRRRCDRVVASIFVNPKQFAPHEDFDRYPREIRSDTEKLSNTGVDLLFAPATEELYPDGFATSIQVSGPGAGLESDFRPHFFSGVATVVAKLLIAAAPDIATFGEKDYQQLLVVRRLACDLGLRTQIVGVPIVREEDRLGMSSRNAYLSPAERAIAGRLNRILTEVGARVHASSAIAECEAFGVSAMRQAGFDAVDYVAVRDAETLAAVTSFKQPVRVLAAVRIGRTRLIDNMA